MGPATTDRVVISEKDVLETLNTTPRESTWILFRDHFIGKEGSCQKDVKKTENFVANTVKIKIV